MELERPDDIYGANMPLLDKLRLLAEWSPLLGRLQMVASADNPHDRALAIIGALQWAAGKSGTPIDDEGLKHLDAVLRSAEGKALFSWVMSKVEEAL